jgi:hypothetical protein
MLRRSWWTSWCERLFQPGSRRTSRKRIHPRRSAREFSRSPAAEVLEVRALLSTITVTSLDDNTTHDGKVTLREALSAANSNISVDDSTAGQSGVQDQIVFQAGLTGTIHLALGQLPISDSVRIIGLGAGSTVIDSGGLSRVFAATSASGNVEFDNLTISGGKTTANFASGAGIQFSSSGTLTLLNTVVSGNATTGQRAYGGGIFTNSGSVTLTNSTLVGNSTAGGYATGGGLSVGTGTVTILNSTVTGNSTSGNVSHGGGFYARTGAVTVTNSTFFGNSTSGYNTYGGAFIAWSGNIVATNITVTQNVANGGRLSEGGGFVASKGSITLTNSIVGGNSSSSGYGADVKFNNFAGTATAVAHNSLIGNNTNTPRFPYPFQPAPLGHPDANGNLIGTAAVPIDPKLAAAAANGGPTLTISPLAGSPVINAGSNALAVDPISHVALQHDQRGSGFNRIVGGTVDMGAFEFVPSSVVLTDTTPATNPSAVEGNDTGSVVLMTFSDSNASAAQSDFTISSINWGTAAVSNTSAQVQLVSRSASASNWQVVGHATYAEPGNDTVAITVKDGSGNSVKTSNTSFNVVDAPLTDTTTNSTVNGTEGLASTNVVLMNFTDGNHSAPAGDFSIKNLVWGGALTGASPNLTVVADPKYSGAGSGWKVVADAVTYAEKGSYTVSLTVHDVDGSVGNDISTNKTSFNVADAPLTDTTTATTVNGTAGQANTNVVLMAFTDDNSFASAGEFSVKNLVWGGTLTGTVPTVTIVADAGYSGAGSGWKVVADTVTYRNQGTFTVSLTVHDADGSDASTSSTSIHINPAPPSQVVIQQTPASGTAGSALSPAVVVAVEDQFGDVVATDSSTVTLSIATGPGAFTATSTVSVSAVNGIATFDNLVLNTSGNYTVTATDGSLSAATSGTITINPAAAAKLSFLQSPLAGITGVTLTPAVQVAVEDQFGNVVTGDSSTVTLNLTSGTFSTGKNSVTAVASKGVATFSGLIVNTTGANSFHAFDGALPMATSSVFRITFPASKLVLQQAPPATGTAGVALTRSVKVAVEDSAGSVVTVDNSTVTLTLSGGTFANGSKTVAVQAVNGVATFDGLIINKVGAYSVTASDGNLTAVTSGTITINPAAAAQLVIQQAPTTGTAGVALSPAVKVAVQDQFGNLVSTYSIVTLTLSSGTFSTGQTTATAGVSSGIATFSSLTLKTAGNYTLTASDGTLPVTSFSVTISPAAASKLVFIQQPPAAGTAGVPLSPAITVAVEDQFGNIVNSAATVTLTLSSGTFSNGSTTATASAVGGVATFGSLSIKTAGTYTLLASSGSLTTATSTSTKIT